MTELALRCGSLFGLEVFGVDALETPDGPLVIEVNEFPNFTAVEDAAELIADHLLQRLSGGPGPPGRPAMMVGEERARP